MVNSDSLRRLELIRWAIVRLGLEGQKVVRFVDRELPVIEVEPGYCEGVKERDYFYLDNHGVRIIWKLTEQKSIEEK